MAKRYREGVFVVVYARVKKEIEYLILKRKLHWKGWEFPKGGIEGKEKIVNTIKRELEEETSLKALKITKFPLSGKYNYSKMLSDREGIIGQTYTLYSAEVKKKPVISLDRQEHSGYKWMKFEDAINSLKWPNQKECLRAVNTSLVKDGVRYREFRINGKTALLGKNQEQNESLVSKFIGKDNLIMHTVASGSPFGVALEGLNGDEKKHLANAVVSYSQDWRDNHSDTKVHVFTGKMVYKDKKMGIGTFGVKGARKMTAKKREIEKWKRLV